VSFAVAPGERLLSSEPLAGAIARALRLQPLPVGASCAPWQTLAPCLDVLRPAHAPLFPYANLGAPRADGSRTHEQLPREFAAAARRRWKPAQPGWADAAARAQRISQRSYPEQSRARDRQVGARVTQIGVARPVRASPSSASRTGNTARFSA
jgi:hypothetical protein